MAIPFASLGLVGQVGNTWGFNLGREKAEPRELSSLGVRGAFNDGSRFRALAGLNVDFGRYRIAIGPMRLRLEWTGAEATALPEVPIRNETGRAQRLRLQWSPAAANTESAPSTAVLALAAGQEHLLALPPIPLQRETIGGATSLGFTTQPPATRVRVLAETGGAVLAEAILRPSLDPLRLWVEVQALARDGAVPVKVTTNLGLRGLSGLTLDLSLRPVAGGRAVWRWATPLQGQEMTLRVPPDAAPWGGYVAEAVLRLGGRRLLVARQDIALAGGAPQTPRELSNLVTELYRHPGPITAGQQEVDFLNPRAGWVLVRATVQVPQGAALSLTAAGRNGTVSLLPAKPGTTGVVEGKVYLPIGRQHVTVQCAAGAALRDLVIRHVPEIAFCQYGYSPVFANSGPYEWPWLSQHVLGNVNCMVGGITDQTRPFMEQWCAGGGKWIEEAYAEPYFKNATADDALAYWTSRAGMTEPLAGGILADEFGLGDRPVYRDMAESVRRMARDPRFARKTFYPYCYGSPSGASTEFIRALFAAGDVVAWEKYLPEQATQADGEQYLSRTLAGELHHWQEQFPACAEHMTVALFYSNAPWPTVSSNPRVDFKVWLDMQVRHLATAPEFRNLAGFFAYTSGYADEETQRWMSALYRHYGLEGRRDLLSPQYGFTYTAALLRNSDFADDAAGWTLRGAEQDSAGTKECSKLSALQERWTCQTEGNRALWTRRSATAPNRASQDIVGLQPGKLYSLRFITADYQDLLAGRAVSANQALAVTLEGADLVPAQCFDQVFGDTRYASPKAYMTYHYRLFRARGPQVRLTLSDWANDTQPGGPAGQELIWNFVEVLPYYEGTGLTP